MILQHIKKSSTSGSDIFFTSRVCVCVCVRVARVQFLRGETRGGGKMLRNICDRGFRKSFANLHAKRSRGERPNHPKISGKKKENRTNKNKIKLHIHPRLLSHSTKGGREYIILKKKKKKSFSLQFGNKHAFLFLFRGKLNSNVSILH